MEPINKSPCNFLFGIEAKDLCNSMTEEVINNGLDTLMRTNIAFLSRAENDGFPFHHTNSGNHQCHLIADLIRRIKKGYKNKSGMEKLAQTEENRFLQLTFLLSFAFINDRPLLFDMIKAFKVDTPLSDKDLKNFINNFQVYNDRVRASLSEVFKNTIRNTFEQAKERSPLHAELHRFIQDEDKNLYIKGLYALPKFIGIAYLINESIPIVIKTKVMTSQGSAMLPTLHYCREGFPTDGDEPVLIFEAVSSEFPVNKCREEAKHCHNYFLRNASGKNRHKANESCNFCTKADISSDQNRLQKVSSCMEETIYALAADYVIEEQPQFKTLLENKEKYPLIAELFEKAAANIEPLGVSMKNPRTLTIMHVYTDDQKHAVSPETKMNMSPQDYVKERLK